MFNWNIRLTSGMEQLDQPRVLRNKYKKYGKAVHVLRLKKAGHSRLTQKSDIPNIIFHIYTIINVKIC